MADDGESKAVPPAKTIFFGSLEIAERARLEREKQKSQGGSTEGGKGAGRENGGGRMVFEMTETGDEGGEGMEEDEGRSEPEGEGGMDEEGGDEEDARARSPGPRQGVASEEGGERFELPESSRVAREKQEALLRELQLKRRARALAVPTNDKEVRLRLRAIEEPVTLFGEREMERRERLRGLMARMEAEGQLDRLIEAVERERRERGEGGEEEDLEVILKSERFFTEGPAALKRARSKRGRARVSIQKQNGC